MNLKEYIEFNRLVSKHIDRRKFFGWFVALVLPFAFFLSAFVSFANQFGGQLQIALKIAWVAIALVGFVTIEIVLYRKAFRPAALKAREEMQRRRTSGDA